MDDNGIVQPDVVNDHIRNIELKVAESRQIVPLSDGLGAINDFLVDAERVYVTDIVDKKLKIFTLDGEFVSDLTKGQGNSPGEVFTPVDFLLKDDRVYVLDPNPRRVSVFDSGGSYLTRFQIPDAALSFDDAGNGFVMLAPMRPDTFMWTDTLGSLVRSWNNVLSGVVHNPLALQGRVLTDSPSSFVYVPVYYPAWIHYSNNGEVEKIVGTMDGRDSGQQQVEGNTNVIRAPDSKLSAYSASISGGTLNLHILDSRNPEARRAFIDRYEIESGEYINSIELPAFTSRVQIIDSLIYYTDKNGLSSGKIVHATD